MGRHSEDKANVGCRAVSINASVGLLVLGILGLTCLCGQTATDVLAQADRLAEQGNWSKARPIYANAEAQFQRRGDRRNELYAKLGRLHGDVQAGSYGTAREEVVRTLAE